MAALVRQMQAADMPSVHAIYAAGIAAGGATFTAEAPSMEEWDRAHLPVCRLVAERDGVVVGFVALTPFSARSVYRGVAELSVYVDPACQGQGIGQALMDALVAQAEANGFWTLLAKVLVGNGASLRLHERSGFRVVGVHERFGQDRDGVWRDVVLLERRSQSR